MDNIGLDLPERESQLCIPTEDGEVIEGRIVALRGAGQGAASGAADGRGRSFRDSRCRPRRVSTINPV
jgi:hypothetical protein